MDDDQLKLEAVNFYSNLYGEHPGPRRDFPSVDFLCLKNEDFNFLNRPVLNEEIKAALFEMAPLKALGSDIFMPCFIRVSGIMLALRPVPRSRKSSKGKPLIQI
ncbi:hypothetical protein J1N35_021756 [Gossypium stocksii]|uniref:Uncharacterized protein n=1 Tax=Gossypium stocksii TaxID=47602 RepID=A0A9D3VET4_9ROSI|nr:hypothetical protein J1N35_021756 [Gossypium stocksii]